MTQRDSRRLVGRPSRRAAIALAAILVAGGGTAVATAADAATTAPARGAGVARSVLSDGWAIGSGPRGAVLTWRSAHRLPVGDARVDVVAGGELLGHATVAKDGRSASVTLPAGTTAGALKDLAVVAGGRRLDGDGPTSLAAQARSSVTARTAPRARAAAPAPEAAAAAPLNPVDPGRPGPFATVSGTYSLTALRIAGLAAPVEVEGLVVAPKGATGKRPLVLLLHGRHQSCYVPGRPDADPGSWPCAPGAQPVPSYKGYVQTQQLLASQGYDTVSISANGINGQDAVVADGGAEARSLLIRHHLALWASWSSGKGRAGAPAIVRSAPVPDLTRTLLVGHSRGGDGINRAAIDSRVAEGSTRAAALPWRVAGLLHLAPTNFGENVAPGVPESVVLPSCDGDVFDLQGQNYTDGLRDVAADRVLRSSLLVVGANHNFFNSEWTPGVSAAPSIDDWFDPTDPVCGSGTGNLRLTPAQQRAVGATYVAAAVKAFVDRDARVLPLLDGTGVRASSAGPARVLSHALGGLRTPLVDPGRVVSSPAPKVAGAGGTTAVVCQGVGGRGSAACPTLAPAAIQPHFLPFGFSSSASEPSLRAVRVTWTRAGGTARVAAAGTASLKGAADVALRVVVPPGTRGTRAAVRVTDARGRSATLGEFRLDGLPRTSAGGVAWGQEVRVPLKAAKGLDLTRVTALTLVPRTAKGSLLLLDAWGHAAGNGPATGPLLPRADVGVSSVKEGNSGTRTLKVRIRVSGPLPSAARRLYVTVADERPKGRTTTSVVTLAKGQRAVDVPIQVTANRIDDGESYTFGVLVKAVNNLTVGDWAGGLTVVDDDPTPTVTVTPKATAVTEGQALTWTVTLSAKSNVDITGVLLATPPAPPATELATDDVPADFLRQIGIEPPVTPVALSAVGAGTAFVVPAGSTSAEFTVPTVTDSRAEGTETVQLTVVDSIFGFPLPPLPGLPAGTAFTGTVADPA